MQEKNKKSGIAVPRRLWTWCMAAALIACGSANAQHNPIDTLTGAFLTYQVNHLPEKIYVHTDKSFYVPGEIIWFKLYNVDGFFHRTLGVSKVAYVEVLSEDHRPLLQAKIALRDGFGSGSFLVPFSVNSGSYLLRAYTNWMKNFPPEFYFEKQVQIINPEKRPARPTQGADSAFDLQFFPEGGNLVNGLESEIAFRLVGKNGRGLKASGIVVGTKGDTLTRFSTFKFGMGHFLFKPSKGNQYKAILITEDNQVIRKPLPEATDSGYVFHLSTADSLHLRIRVDAIGADEGMPVFLVTHTRGLIKSRLSAMLRNGNAEFLIDRRVLKDGISQITLFDDKLRPQCERLYFSRPVAALDLQLKAGQPQVGRREKVELTLSARSAGRPVSSASCSLSVFLADSLQGLEPGDIRSYLWLESDLKGHVESPSYYLESEGVEAEAAADNLMLTQGWRRFHWKEVLENPNRLPEFLPEFDGHQVQARIISRRSGTPVAHVATYLAIPGSRFELHAGQSNEKGLVRFDVQRFYGNAEMILQTNTGEDSLLRIEMVNPFSEKYSQWRGRTIDLPATWADQLVYRSRNAQVQNEFVVNKRQPFVSPVFPDSTAFYGVPDNKYFLDEYTRFTTMEEVMREYVKEVHVRKQKDQFHFDVQNIPYQQFFENDPLVLLDGLPVFDVNKIMAMDPLKIKKLEVIARKYSLDSVVHLGILSFSTYEGNLAGFTLDPNALVVDYPGLQLEREFFSPVYEAGSDSLKRVPDFRNLLYWSPDVQPDSSGQQKITFYSSDLPGNYIGIIQGITSQGEAGSGWVKFSVRK